MSGRVVSRWIGRIPYTEGLNLQDRLVGEKLAGDKQDHLLLLEHDPVFTMGRSRDESSLGKEADLPFPAHRTNRGGQATYHGPGQLVGYPILDLKECGTDLHRYLRFIEEVIISLLDHHGVTGNRIEGKTGVWVGDRKIASLGIGVRRWITMHGFAVNICGDLTPFQHITPCGLSGVEMTSMQAEGAVGVTVESCAREVAGIFNDLLQEYFPAEAQGRRENQK
jgi:lipoyl(octanoyl) transferase